MAIRQKSQVRWSVAKNPTIRLYRNHMLLVQDWWGAEFYNYGSSSGDDFISSKTSMGRVTSKLVKGRIRHYLGDGEIPMRGCPEGAS